MVLVMHDYTTIRIKVTYIFKVVKHLLYQDMAHKYFICLFQWCLWQVLDSEDVEV